MKRAVRFLVLLLTIGIGIAGVMLPLRQQEQDPEQVVITRTEFVKTDAATPPSDGPWVGRELPDNWSQTNPGQSGYGWYRATFSLAAVPTEAGAAYRPTASTTYQMYVNGADSGSSGGMVGPITRSMGVPRLDPIAPQFLRPGVNELLVRLRVASWVAPWP